MGDPADAGQAPLPECIAAQELFHALPPAALSDIAALAGRDRFEREACVFTQGSPVTRAYAVAAGSIRIVQTGRDGRQAVVRFVGPGEMFGALPLFTDHRFPADAIAVERTWVLSWRESDLRALIERYPAIALNLIQVLGARMAQLQARVRELTTQCAEQRIAHAVLRLLAQSGRRGRCGTTIEIPLRRKDLAEYAGTTLHTASRTLAAWARQGLVGSHAQRLTVHDVPALRRFAESLRP